MYTQTAEEEPTGEKITIVFFFSHTGRIIITSADLQEGDVGHIFYQR